MGQSDKRGRKARPGTPAGSTLTRTDWLRVCLILGGMGLVFCGWIALVRHLNYETDLRRTLSRWRAEYHLTDEQERQIRKEEERFHSNDNPLNHSRRTPEEIRAHELAISRFMNTEDGARFLATHVPPLGEPTK
jgi:hypothetical protein